LVFGWGNPSRGDDALGPLAVDAIERLVADHPQWGGVEVLTDFQLQVEHALDLEGRKRVLFIDAAMGGLDQPFSAGPIGPARDGTITTHAASPQGIMQVFQDLTGRAPPPATLLAIYGQSFELGDDLSDTARHNLAQAMDWVRSWLSEM
jgi:hydrogenase maturation protease